MPRLAGLFASWLVLTSTLACPAIAQIVVYSNQADIGNSFANAFANSTEWDDLQLEDGGLLSELSLIVRRAGGGPQFASGFFDLRVFDEAGNFPQGDLLGVIPFSGEFPATPAGPAILDGVLIGLTGLESHGIVLPDSARIGLGVQFDDSGWGLIPSGPAEIGSSPGGNWVDESPTERFEFGTGLAYRLAVADPTPPGPGIGNYSLFETGLATPDDPFSNSGAIASDQFFRAIGFNVERTTQISQVGGYMGGNGTLFAAIVETSGIFGAPDPPDLSGDNVLATTLLELPGSGRSDVVADLDVTLEPGTYALVFGSGKFGAEGEGSLRYGHIPNGDWFPYGIRQSDGQQTFTAGVQRIFAVAQSAPGTVQVRPTFDLLAEVPEGDFSGEVGQVRLIDGEEQIIVDSHTAPNPNEHAVLEFSLENVPADREITRVELELHLDLITFVDQVRFDVFGYAGDGAAQRSDAVGPQTVVGQTNFSSSSSGNVAVVDIDPAFVESLVGTASHLGLTIAPDGSGDNFRFYTLESSYFGEPPLLTISLAPPPVTGLAGDYNNDGTVDAADYTRWRDLVGQMVALPNETATPGMVTQEDYDEWVANFGNSLGSAALANATVPEPATFAMLLVGIAALGRRRKES